MDFLFVYCFIFVTTRKVCVRCMGKISIKGFRRRSTAMVRLARLEHFLLILSLVIMAQGQICPLGLYKFTDWTYGYWYCKNCEAGYFCPDYAGRYPCTQCNAGTSYVAACTTTANVQCASCVAGTSYSTTTNAATCTPCGTCPVGTRVIAACTTTADVQCVAACVAGASYEATTNAATCTPCDTCAAGSRVATACNTTANVQCAACAAGTSYSTAVNAANCALCRTCAAGQYVVSACSTTANTVCSGTHTPIPAPRAPPFVIGYPVFWYFLMKSVSISK
jgi:hypothetical protein